MNEDNKKNNFNFFKIAGENREKYKEGYKKYESKAREYFNDKEKVKNLFNNAKQKAETDKDALEEIAEKLQLLLAALQAWFKGTYKEIPKKSIIMIIAAIIYFVSPVDLIPDMIPGFGYIDDAAVIAFLIKQLTEDLEKFKSWKETNKDWNADEASTK
ncbi:YkvA family protein [Planococcus sp. SIMBA_160]